VNFTKARNIFGKDVEPFEVSMRTENGAAIWLMREILDIQLVRAREMFGNGMSIRDVADELGISKSAAARLKQKIGSAI